MAKTPQILKRADGVTDLEMRAALWAHLRSGEDERIMQAMAVAVIETANLLGVKPTKKFVADNLKTLAPFLDALVEEADRG